MSVPNDRDRLDIEAMRFIATIKVLEAATVGCVKAINDLYEAIDAAGQDDPRKLRAALWAWWETVPYGERNNVLAALRRIFGDRGKTP